VARIAGDDGSSSTNLSPAVMQLCETHFSVHFTHVSYTNYVTRFITARRLDKRGICRRRVSVSVCVCHTPVLYQNG